MLIFNVFITKFADTVFRYATLKRNVTQIDNKYLHGHFQYFVRVYVIESIIDCVVLGLRR